MVQPAPIGEEAAGGKSKSGVNSGWQRQPHGECGWRGSKQIRAPNLMGVLAGGGATWAAEAGLMEEAENRGGSVGAPGLLKKSGWGVEAFAGLC